MHEPMIGQIHHFFLSKIELIPFIIANQQHKSMRTSRIDRCEPRYAGTEFTNREDWQPLLTRPFHSLLAQS